MLFFFHYFPLSSTIKSTHKNAMGGRRCALPPTPLQPFFIIYPTLYLSNSYSDTSLPYFSGGGGVVTPPPPPGDKFGGGGVVTSPPPKPARDKTGRTISFRKLNRYLFFLLFPFPFFPIVFFPKDKFVVFAFDMVASGKTST